MSQHRFEPASPPPSSSASSPPGRSGDSASHSTHAAASVSTHATEATTPRKLELILNHEDGSLQTAPLLTVVMATTDSLYSDLYRMAHGEVDVTSAQPAMGPDDYGGGGGGEYDDYEPPPPTTSGGGRSKERLSNLSFAQRRHELAWRLASHSRAVTHVAALTAAAATTELGTATAVSTKALVHARAAWASADEAQDALYFFHANLFPARKPPHDVWGALDTCLLRSWPDLPTDLKLTVDRYETSAERSWPAQEVSDRWQMAVRSKLLLGEVGWMRGAHHHRRPDDRQQDHHQQRHRQQVPTEPPPPSVPWKISVRGGVVRLTHGRAKTTVDASTGTTKTLYPLEAILTVLTPTTTTTATTAGSGGTGFHRTGDGSPSSALDAAEWTLFSVEVHAQAKTGQSNHQLDTTNGQRFNMHRLCALAMSREEARVRKMELQRRERQEQQQQQQGGKVQHGQQPQHVTTTTATSTSLAPARPLHALFQVAHHFALSWQLEILSAQAQALRKGLWGDPGGSGGGGGAGKASGSSGAGPSIVVTPVQFFENRSILGIVSISFWSVDDRYGPPDMGDLTCVDEDDDEEGDEEDDDGDAHGETTSRSTHKSSSDSVSTVSRSINNPSVTNQLTLSVRAELNVGIRVSLSGAESIMEFATVQPHVRSTIRELVEATSNPFGLSASEALLAATRLCAERKCHAMVAVLPKVLPEWISLRVEKGSIAVAATIRYHTGATDGNGDRGTTQPSSPVVLFRLACDARTGSFVSTFSHSTPLLQYMACNDLRAASDATLLRLAGLAQLRRTAAAASRGAAAGAASFESGRAVRDAFEALGRSMNVLGQRTGVGGSWRDHDDMSASLRQRAVQLACVDVKVSIVTCCGMAALYGLAAVAIGVATGVQASPDMAGGRLEPQLNGQNLEPGLAFLAAPPLSLLVDQKVVESSLTTSDGDRVKSTFIEQELFGICCTVDDTKGLTLYGAEVKVKLDSPISIPVRTAFSLAAFVDDYATSTELGAAGSHGIGMNGSHEEMEPAAKRPKLNGSGDTADPPIDIKVEAGRFASMLSQTLEI